MTLSGITVTFSETINVGNYESIKPEIRISAELEPGDDLDLCHAQLCDQARRLYAEQALEQLRVINNRRKSDPTKKHEFRSLCDSTIAQLKEQLSSSDT